MSWLVLPPSVGPVSPSTTYSAWGPSPPASGALRVDASSFSGVGINIIGSTSNILTGALTGVTTLTTSGAINGQTISAAAAFTGTMTVASGMLLGAATGGMPGVGVINAKGFKIDGVDVGISTDTYWAASGTGINYTAGPVGIGASAVAADALLVLGTGMTGTDQRGLVLQSVASSASTSSFAQLQLKTRTAAAAFTATNAWAIILDAPEVGAGSAVTNHYGMRIFNQGAAGITNAYGLYLDAVSGAATTNISFYNGGASTLTGNVGIGGAAPTSVALYVASTTLATADAIGAHIRPTFPATSTGSGTALAVQVIAASAAFTIGTGYAAYIGAPSLSNTAVTTIYGVYVTNQGQAKSTNAYGVYIAAQSGAATTNVGLYNAGSTTLAGQVTLDYVGQAIVMSGSGTTQSFIGGTNTGGAFRLGMDSSVGGVLVTGAPAYATVLGTTNATAVVLGTNGAANLTIASGGAATFTSSVRTTNIGINGAPTATSKLNITGLPTSAAGLAAGDVWSNSGVLTIV